MQVVVAPYNKDPACNILGYSERAVSKQLQYTWLTDSNASWPVVFTRLLLSSGVLKSAGE